MADDIDVSRAAAAAAQSCEDGSADARREGLSAAARRALEEAEARRAAAVEEARPREIAGRDGPEPVRYGDWEVKGIASDF